MTNPSNSVDELLALARHGTADMPIGSAEWSAAISCLADALPSADGAESAGEPFAITDELVRYIARYGGMCRGCADSDGVCPHDGLPCENRSKAIRSVLEALNYGVSNGFIALSPPPLEEGESLAGAVEQAVRDLYAEYQQDECCDPVRINQLIEVAASFLPEWRGSEPVGSSALAPRNSGANEDRERAALAVTTATPTEIARAAWAWRNSKDRETDHGDQTYFYQNWRSLPGLGAYVSAEVEKWAVLERRAREIYEEWSAQPGFVPWVERGNSRKQDEARLLARAELDDASLSGDEQKQACSEPEATRNGLNTPSPALHGEEV